MSYVAKWCIAFFIFVLPWSRALSFDGRDYEEPAGMSVAVFSEVGGKVYGGGMETAIWLRDTPVIGEWFGHWLSNDYQEANYYAVGLSMRLMPRTVLAPFSGGGAAYNGLLDEHRTYDLLDPPDKRYWTGFVDAGFRWSFATQFLEATYRYHWAGGTKGRDFGTVSLEYGLRF